MPNADEDGVVSGRDLTLAALQAARRGWLVYPIRPHSKRPYFGRVADLATTDPDAILLWFDDVYRDADLGSIPPGHIIRIDVDRHGTRGGDGIRTVPRWRSEGHTLPPTLTASTPRAGQHLYFRCYEAVTSHPICPDGSVELKTGSTILPPSHGRKWLGYGDETILDLPDWLYDKWRDERQRRWREHGAAPTVAAASELVDRIAIVTGSEPWVRGYFGSFRCPAHNDRRASAWLRTKEPVIVGCSAGCAPAAILQALGVTEVKPRIPLASLSAKCSEYSSTGCTCPTPIPLSRCSAPLRPTTSRATRCGCCSWAARWREVGAPPKHWRAQGRSPGRHAY